MWYVCLALPLFELSTWQALKSYSVVICEWNYKDHKANLFKYCAASIRGYTHAHTTFEQAHILYVYTEEYSIAANIA